MSLRPHPMSAVPTDTARVAQAAFPKGNLYMTLQDELGTLYMDDDVTDLFPTHGQPAACPWRLALICILQFVEHLLYPYSRGLYSSVKQSYLINNSFSVT